MRIGLNSPQDFLALLVRRKWWVIAPFLALTSVISVLIYVLPRIYVSETLILIRQRDVSEDFVMDLIAGTTEQRLESIQQTVLSRTNLLQVLREFEDRLPEYRPLNIDQKVVKLREDITIFFELDRRAQQPVLTYFKIAYQNPNPELAQKIADKLTTLFIDQDIRARESQVYGTTEFLSAELDKVSEQLRQSEQELKDVKSERQFELPENLETNLRSLDQLMLRKQTNTEALDRYATLRLNLETQLAQTPEIIPRPLTGPQAQPVAQAGSLIAEYRTAETLFRTASAKYTPKHPEVQAAKKHLDGLKEQIPPEALEAAEAQAPGSPAEQKTDSGMMPNPLFQSLTAQLREVKTEYTIREREKGWIETEIGKYSRRLENTPNSEQQIADVLRLNTDLQKQYEDLKSKLSQARLAESLESKQKGAQFQIVDPANLPLIPTKPNKLMLTVGGSLASLIIAIALAVGVDVTRQRVWTQSDVEAFWGVPVLVDIPQILTDGDVAAIRKRKFTWLASSMAVALTYSCFLYVVYWKHRYILMKIDPVIQSLYK